MNTNWRSSWSVFVESWRMLRSHLMSVVQLWAIEVVLQVVLFAVILMTEAPSVTDFAIATGIVLLYVYRLMMSMALISLATDRQSRRLRDIFKHSVLMKLPAAAGLSLLLAIAVTVASFALLVPGLVLAVFWSMSLAVLTVENTNVRNALRGSVSLVRGWGWPVFSRMLFVFMILTVLNIIALVPGIGAGVASVLTFVLAPVLMFYYVLTYQELAEVKRYKHLQNAQVPLLGKISVIVFALITGSIFAVVSSIAPYVTIVMNAAADHAPKQQEDYRLKVNPDGSISQDDTAAE